MLGMTAVQPSPPPKKAPSCQHGEFEALEFWGEPSSVICSQQSQGAGTRGLEKMVWSAGPGARLPLLGRPLPLA